MLAPSTRMWHRALKACNFKDWGVFHGRVLLRYRKTEDRCGQDLA